MSTEPFVSVVTPVYNGGKFLRECIESVLAQTHGNFEYIILDNASTDDTPEIIADYALRDARVRPHRNESTLWVIDNWNRALEKISADSHYCKILHADDTLHPDCLERMTRLAVRYPNIGMVGSLRTRGKEIECRGLPTGRSVFEGAAIARMFFRQEVFAIAPSSGFVRSDIVRERRPFYRASLLHADLDTYFSLLSRHAFGFIDEALTFSRVHEGSITTTVARKKETLMKEWLLMLQEHGPKFFQSEELAEVERAYLRRYYRVLVRGFATGRGREFLDYHWEGLKEAHRQPSVGDLCIATATETALSLAQPGKLYRHVRGAALR